jgi:hypothetical protein
MSRSVRAQQARRLRMAVPIPPPQHPVSAQVYLLQYPAITGIGFIWKFGEKNSIPLS